MADDSNAADIARSQAEARRKRILERADKRLGVVSGEQVEDDEVKKQSSLRAARVRAARSRRYGKKSTIEVGNKHDSAGSSAVEDSPVASSKAVEDSPVASSKAVEESDIATQPAGDVKLPSTSENSNQTVTSETSESEGIQNDAPKEGSQKKYLGVARMRRQMILKKKMAEAGDESGEGPKTDRSNAIETESDARVSTKTIATPSRIPVYMHIFTVFLLFMTGLDVGLQQFHEDMEIHSSLSIKEFGIPILSRPVQKSPEVDISFANAKHSDTARLNDAVDSEFDEEIEEKEPNIDPLFRVDLDDYVQGPGVVNQLAKGAISIHRLLLSIFYYGPMSLLYSLLSVPRACLRTPPALCVLALFLRQIVAKVILKAGLPTQEANEKESAIDVLAMAKQWITKFLSSTFPTAVGMYDAFVHLRADIYVVTCGVFLGIAWTTLSSMQVAEIETPVGAITTDEL